MQRIRNIPRADELSADNAMNSNRATEVTVDPLSYCDLVKGRGHAQADWPVKSSRHRD